MRKTLVHITHEAAFKVGGIGSVIEGLVTSSSYRQATQRSIILGPLFRQKQQSKFQPLGQDGHVLYSSLHNITEQPYRRAFADVEKKFGIHVVYGKRMLRNPETDEACPVEVILIDTHHANQHPINAFKSWLYEDFGIESNRYEDDECYDEYVRMAPAAIAVLRALSVSSPQNPALLVAHEHMGMPTALAGIMDPLGSFKTIYYAHEVPTVRNIVEHHPGHDTMFLNTLKYAQQNNYYLDEIFGIQTHDYRHVLTSAAANCDTVIAVSPQVRNELLLLGPQFHHENMQLVYNGIHAEDVSLDDKIHAKTLLRQYAHNLLGSEPDYIFSHVARACVSKAFWRDLAVLDQLDRRFGESKQTGVCFVVSTSTFAKTPARISQLETNYNWPVDHIEENGDLSGDEAGIWESIRYFNERHEHIKVVFINQFGFDQASCGKRMPEEMTLRTLRMGSDAEFSLSVYEPFGIAPLEPLTYGGLCVLSNSCGCLSLLHEVIHTLPNNVITADYSQLPDIDTSQGVKAYLHINQSQRDQIEYMVAQQTAEMLYKQLPRSTAQAEKLLDDGYLLAQRMSWESIVENYVLGALDEAYLHRRVRRIA